MPVVGLQEAAAQRARLAGSNYEKSSMHDLSQLFVENCKSILNESRLDLFYEPKKVLNRDISRKALKDFFVENCCDTNPAGLSLEEQEDERLNMEQQFENDANCILNPGMLWNNGSFNEASPIADYNPVIGMVFPVHKNVLMNMVFDKGGIDKCTTASPRFTITMETRILIAPDGTEIDMFTEQNKMTDAINMVAPTTIVELALPEYKTTDVLKACGSTNSASDPYHNRLDHLSIDTEICAVMIPDVQYEIGDLLPNDDGYVDIATSKKATAQTTQDTWYRVNNMKFQSSYGKHTDRSFISNIVTTCNIGGTIKKVNTTITGTMDRDQFIILAQGDDANVKITKVRLKTRLETSSQVRKAASVSWSWDTITEEIPDAMPINTTVTPDEVKDIAALYKVNQTTKIMSLMKTSLSNYKDDMIKRGLDESYRYMPEESKIYANFNFLPQGYYGLDPVEWRHKTFFDYLDQWVTKLVQVLNDPNVTISVYGDPDMVKRITPMEVTYTAPSNIGPIELDFTRTVVTSNKRVYNFFGTDKMRNDTEFIIVLKPRNTDRIIYRIYNYMMYVSNEIRNFENPALPAITAYERWKLVSYQPVQGRMNILNPSGYDEEKMNPAPVVTPTPPSGEVNPSEP